MPSVGVKLYSVFFKFMLKQRLNNLITTQTNNKKASTSAIFGVTCRPEESIIAANPTFTEADGVATKDIHVDPFTSLTIRIFLPQSSISVSQINPNVGEYGGYSPFLDDHKKLVNKKLPIILQFHGGGFVFGSNDTVANDYFCRRIAKLCDVMVIAVGYRLAPENRYPAAFEDGVKVLNWLGKQANLAECSKSSSVVGNNNKRNSGAGNGGESRKLDGHGRIADAFGASMVEPWLAAHGDPSSFSHTVTRLLLSMYIPQRCNPLKEY
ncbi:hypothetical protein IFM89_006434 [Coptis chinensis]|uniref:Alpha/beta hydrolase fold-3 domain-containing protein n=1 Tax=Coptis chinensis TaxID=261450 RepID=A0A835HRD6_9MAGN|nr:hypothetical protein IFM89_006434 [Coptis chinensis]